jgi:VanZ family protein
VTGSDPSTPPSAHRWSRRLWLGVFVVVALTQLVTVYAPSGPKGPEINGLDKVVHLTIFAAPAFAGLAAGFNRRWLLPVLAVHGPVSEVVQWLALPHRDGSVYDALADLCGVALGWLVFRAVGRALV